MASSKTLTLATDYNETIQFRLYTQKKPHQFEDGDTVYCAIVTCERDQYFKKDIPGNIVDPKLGLIEFELDTSGLFNVDDTSKPPDEETGEYPPLNPLGKQRLEIQVRAVDGGYLHWEQPIFIVKGHMPAVDLITWADSSITFARSDITFSGIPPSL